MPHTLPPTLKKIKSCGQNERGVVAMCYSIAPHELFPQFLFRRLSIVLPGSLPDRLIRMQDLFTPKFLSRHWVLGSRGCDAYKHNNDISVFRLGHDHHARARRSQ